MAECGDGQGEQCGASGAVAGRGRPERAGETVAALVRCLDELGTVPSGFAAVDRMTGGFQRADLIVVAGRPSMGKTAFMVNAADRATRAHDGTEPVLIVSLETPARMLAARMLALVAGVERTSLLSGASQDRPALREALADMRSRSLWIDDKAATVEAIRASALGVAGSVGLRMLLVDALQVIRPQQQRQDRGAELEEIAWSLKALAQELCCPVLVSSYLHRGPERRIDRRPYLSDLRGSAALEEAADLVLLLYRDDVYNPDSSLPGTVEITVAKNRNGPLRSTGRHCWLAYNAISDRVEDSGGETAGR